MITTQEVKVQAQSPSMPLNPFTAFKGSPSSIRVLDVPKKIGLWNITSVQIQVTYPDSHIVSKECVRTGNVWVGTLEGTLSVGSVCKGYKITASGVDEDGSEISGYVLGVGDVVIIDLDGSIYPSESADFVKIFGSKPENPKTGDVYLDGEALMVYDGTTWTKVGGVVPDPNNKGWALNATNANTASYASQATNSENANYATYALRAGHDSDGNAFSQTYVKKSEVVPDTNNIGYAMNASYALNSTVAQTSQHASLATKAEQDENGNNIATTYAKKDEIKNSKVTITQGGVEKGYFTLNQAEDKTIEIDAGGGGGDAGHTLTIKGIYQYGGGSSGSVYVNGLDIEYGHPNLRARPIGMDTAVQYIDTNLPELKFYNQTIVFKTGTCKVDNGPVTSEYGVIQLTSDTTIYVYNLYCLAGGTKILLANGSEKNIEDINYNDDLLVWNFDKGCLDSAKPFWIKKKQTAPYFWNIKLDDGTSIRACGPKGHEFFSVDKQDFVYGDELVGQTVLMNDGKIAKCVSSSLVKEEVDMYNLMTDKHINCFANGVLAGCSLCKNLYKIENLKFVKEQKNLRKYEEFEGEVPQWWFNAARYAESSSSHETLVKYYSDRINLMK